MSVVLNFTELLPNSLYLASPESLVDVLGTSSTQRRFECLRCQHPTAMGREEESPLAHPVAELAADQRNTLKGPLQHRTRMNEASSRE